MGIINTDFSRGQVLHMRKLYHYILCPFSRKVRIVLGEKKLEFEHVLVRPWEQNAELLRLNPEGLVPVLIDEDGQAYSNSHAISEYLDEVYFEPHLLGESATQRAETRRLVAWFDEKFNAEVTHNIVYEKAIKRKMGHGSPDTTSIRAGNAHIHDHLEYIAWLCERRNWLAGDSFSLADIAAAAHLSCIDYFDDVPWHKHKEAKDWYARVKSRPSLRGVLSDVVPAITPSAQYADLDF